MTMETVAERDPLEEYWATHRRAEQIPFAWFYEEQRLANPWCNGRYALASIVWGLILMLVWSLSI
jgi:hypothetical protein